MVHPDANPFHSGVQIVARLAAQLNHLVFSVTLSPSMLHTIEVKIYPTNAQADALEDWLRVCRWVYNQALEHRIKAYKRRRESVSYQKQTALLTRWRRGNAQLRAVPVGAERSALRRVERGMQSFFRRCKVGEKPGFPRFRSRDRFNSVELLETGRYIRGNRVAIPKIGSIRCRGSHRVAEGMQRLLRVVRRASGWFAQVLIEEGKEAPAKRPVERSIGIDLGLTTWAAMSDGSRIENPRFLRWSVRKLRSAQRRVSRRMRGSKGRRKAIRRLRLVHERIAAQRRNFAHKHSTDLVRRFDLIAVEDLNVRGLTRSALAKPVNDAAWSMFAAQLERKAEWAGATVVKVDPRGTSQECPSCGHIKAKKLSEREHRCERCGLVLDRDVAAARIVLARALGVRRGESPVEEVAAADGDYSPRQAAPTKREGSE